MPARGVSHVFLTSDAVGGAWTYAAALTRRLLDTGLQVTLATVGPAPDPTAARALREAGAAVVVTGLPLDWTARTRAEATDGALALACLAAQYGPDVAHLHAPAFAAADWPCPVAVTVHSCTSTWWRAVRGGAMPDAFRWRHLLTRDGLRRASAAAAPSRAFAQAVAETYGVATPLVCSNGIDAPACAPARPVARFALTAGRLWDEGKNAAVLDAAAATGADIRAAGPVRGPNGAQAALAHLTLLGPLDPAQMAAALAVRPVFAAPSLYEPFGLSVLEAARAACPLVLSDIPTFRELWDGSARFVPARDPQAWAGALAALHGDPAQADALGRAAQARSLAFGGALLRDGALALYAAARAERAA